MEKELSILRQCVTDLRWELRKVEPLLDAMHAMMSSPDEILPIQDITAAINLLLGRASTTDHFAEIMRGLTPKMNSGNQVAMLEMLFKAMGNDSAHAIMQALNSENSESLLVSLFDAVTE
eukprot:5524251-Prymnesium_polylepis.1